MQNEFWLSLLYLQGFIDVIAGTSMILSSVVSERNEMARRKDSFISMASHELKTPVTSLNLYLQLLQKQWPVRKKGSTFNYFSKVRAQTEKLNNLISDLLDLSKMSTGRLEYRYTNFELNEVVADCVDNIKSSSKKHEFIIRGKIEKKVFGDPERISQALINLLSNAVKYSPKGGKVKLTLQENTRSVSISVRDNGIGISKEQQDKVFERFYQVGGKSGKPYPGLGIGLYITSEIIRNHGGKIQVESKEGKGAIFTIKLPRKV